LFGQYVSQPVNLPVDFGHLHSLAIVVWAFAPSVEGWWFNKLVASLVYLHLLLARAGFFSPLSVEQDFLVHCQYNMTGWGMMFICSMLLCCASSL